MTILQNLTDTTFRDLGVPRRSLRALLYAIMTKRGFSLRELYRTLETRGANRLRDAHAALDAAVRAADGEQSKNFGPRPDMYVEMAATLIEELYVRFRSDDL